MRNFFIVLKYTILENARKKTFIVTNFILVMLTILMFNIGNIADAFSDDKNTNTGDNGNTEIKKVAILDDNNLYQEYLNNYQIPDTNYTFIKSESDDLDKLKEDINNYVIDGVVIIETKNNVPTFKYIVKDQTNMLSADVVSAIIKSTYTSSILAPYNVDNEILTNVNVPVTYELEQADGEGPSISLYIISIVMSLLLYLSIYFYGYSVSLSISNEKTSRVMETLVTSTKPSSIVLGKTIAMGILGLAQLLLLIVTALITYKLCVSDAFVIFGETVDLSSVTPTMLIMLVIYFVLGYFLYAMLNAVAGATVSKAEDLHSASMPVSFISLISFYLGYFSLMNPVSGINTFASIMPFSSVFTMPPRMIMASVPMWQTILSIVLLLGTIVLLAYISIRIYSAAILHYGERLSLKKLFNMSKDN